MSPETRDFAEHRWAKATRDALGVRLAYGVGRVCASYTLFADPVEAVFAEVAWMAYGEEPRRSGTLTGLQPVTCEQIAAYERAAARLEAGHV